ncbi:CDGSH iron-sulfur domain-containing protein 3, mitochondrial isoform X2 [Python bivittatus]|uniref:CDGSH iron-sulfur domain-containing protein 3, mitochondrial isoform X1 n=1 Tax=Python bivittatus TaxID=176946 RepID=A0A9F5MV99_PYTBI|nr:CDGSH iron-sulfur domain-containing protein 3, mitochondrial isoform X1 [Python bivittatus]XP_025020332.1 CDGSH iron-sulfur domain-containing protein 3, mitochondrial isoform X2 [Python bivittatus]
MPGLRKASGLVASAAGSFRRLFFSQIRSCSVLSTSSAKPVIAAKEPFPVDLQARKPYAWCACGHSQKQPFCDGTHKKNAPEISPLRFTLEEAKKAWLCGCKYTKNPPYCDGTHKEDFVQKADLHAQPQV